MSIIYFESTKSEKARNERLELISRLHYVEKVKLKIVNGSHIPYDNSSSGYSSDNTTNTYPKEMGSTFQYSSSVINSSEKITTAIQEDTTLIVITVIIPSVIRSYQSMGIGVSILIQMNTISSTATKL